MGGLVGGLYVGGLVVILLSCWWGHKPVDVSGRSCASLNGNFFKDIYCWYSAVVILNSCTRGFIPPIIKVLNDIRANRWISSALLMYRYPGNAVQKRSLISKCTITYALLIPHTNCPSWWHHSRSRTLRVVCCYVFCMELPPLLILFFSQDIRHKANMYWGFSS